MKKFIYLLAVTLCMGLAACGGDDDNNGVVPPATNNNQNGNTKQTLPDPEGTIIVNIPNDGNYENGIYIDGRDYHYVYMDNMNNLCVTSNSPYFVPSIVNLGKVAGLAAITKVPQEGFSDEKVLTSEGDGFVIRAGGLNGSFHYNYVTICRMYLAAYLRDAMGNIIGATIKYQKGNSWVEIEAE